MITLCNNIHSVRVFHHYAYGDPLDIYARYVGELDNDAKYDNAIMIHISCQREVGHSGKHLAYGTLGWEDA